jgi:hypothetical protein
LLPKAITSDPDKYGLFAGDTDRDGEILVQDIRNIQAGLNVDLFDTVSPVPYLNSKFSLDLDMDGEIIVEDIRICRRNLNLSVDIEQ